MPEKVTPGPVADNVSIREAVCIHTKKIFDSCRDKDCIEDLRVYLTRTSQEVLEHALSVKAGTAQLLCAAIESAEKAGKEPGDEYSQAVINALKATNGVSGVTSDGYSFDQSNNPVKAAAIIELKAGQEVFKEMY